MSGVGLYVHIPYCTSICPYCDFNAYVAPKAPWEKLKAALLRELETRAVLYKGPLDSIYFGGGTPSLAPAEVINHIIVAAQEHLQLRPQAEITLEANPGTLDAVKLEALRAAGINRLSLGWQSTSNTILRVLGRGHSAQDSAESFGQARQAGFDAISLDLMFAVPGQTRAQLQADLDKIVALSPEHVSLYAMTYKAGTPFERRRQQGTLTPVDEAIELEMMLQISSALESAGYVHYEVSNYAKAGASAIHNTLYWQGGQYLGIGPGAHSYLRKSWLQGWRWESLRKPEDYISIWSTVGRDAAHFLDTSVDNLTTTFIESLTAQQLRTERLLCGLRHIDGIPLDVVIKSKEDASHHSGLHRALTQKWLYIKGHRLLPTAQGMQNADGLALLLA